MPKRTPERVTMSSRFSRIHFLVSAVTLRGPWEAETSCPPILANRYSENRAEDFSSISLGRQQAAYKGSVPVAYEQADPADLPKLPSRDLSRLTAGPRQHHDDEGLPFWGCFGKSVRKDQSLAPTRRLNSLAAAWRMPTSSIVVPG